jgi:hypothetical protein
VDKKIRGDFAMVKIKKRIDSCIGEICFNSDGSITVDVRKAGKSDPKCAESIIRAITSGKEVNFKVGAKKE